MSISGIESTGFTPYVAPSVSATGVSAPKTAATSGSSQDFGSLVLDGLDRLEGLQDKSDNLAVKAATGDLTSIHDYTIASTEASVATQLTVAVRNKAVDAFNEIMRMQV
jgi:flagellar hook-basal body complex protein FliE